MFLHGTLPFIEAQSVPVQAVVSGTVKCIVDKGSLFSITCLRLGFPIGYRVIYGYPSFFVSAFLYKFLSINPVDGLQIFDSICIILGSVSLYIGIKRITNNPLSGLLAPLLFYISPFMVNLGGGALYQGFVLLPFCLGVSILIFSGLNNQLNKMVSLRFSFLILLQFLLLLALIWMDGYSYIMTITAIIIFCLVDFIWLFLKNKQINIQKKFHNENTKS